MPLHAFHCGGCGGDFELFLRPSEVVSGVPCPDCGEPTRREFPEEAAVDGPSEEPAPVCGLPRGT